MHVTGRVKVDVWIIWKPISWFTLKINRLVWIYWSWFLFQRCKIYRSLLINSHLKLFLRKSAVHVHQIHCSSQSNQSSYARSSCFSESLRMTRFFLLKPIIFYTLFIWSLLLKDSRTFNPSHPNPGWREKINLNLYFHTSLWCLKRFYEDL